MKDKRKGQWLVAVGLLLIAAALFLAGYNVWSDRAAGKERDAVLTELRELVPVREAETGKKASADNPTPAPYMGDSEEIGFEDPMFEEPVYPDYVLNPNMEMPAQQIYGYDYIAMLSIPALELELPVMDEWDYTRLRINPCRYAGTAYLRNLVICAHNYTSHFGRLSSLSIGDEIILTDMDGNVFRYLVGEIMTLGPAAVEEMTDSGWDLTLFTCTLGGATRVTVRCEMVE